MWEGQEESIKILSIMIFVRCGRALLQSTVVVDLLVVQVLEFGPVTEGQLQHLSL